jgi:hypothetical protein
MMWLRRNRREPVTDDERPKRKIRILAVLAKVADDSQFLAQLAENPEEVKWD